jgi:hypothetical protein
MLNFERASKILEDHFANLTDEEFITNLKDYCPKIFEKNKISDETELRIYDLNNHRSRHLKTLMLKSLKKNQHGQNEYDIS